MLKTIYLAGGCFWGVEEYFRRTNGVVQTLSGYCNGTDDKASYYELYRTGHAEAVKVIYDSDIIQLNDILLLFASIVDPTSINKQGNDMGIQYRTGIYYLNDVDKGIVLDFMAKLQKKYSKPLAIEVDTMRNFVPAEENHQKYLLKNPSGYCHIKLPVI